MFRHVISLAILAMGLLAASPPAHGAGRKHCAVFSHENSRTLDSCPRANGRRELCYRTDRDCFYQDAFRRCVNLWWLRSELARQKESPSTASCVQGDVRHAAECLRHFKERPNCTHLKVTRVGHSTAARLIHPFQIFVQLAESYPDAEFIDVDYQGCATFHHLAERQEQVEAYLAKVFSERPRSVPLRSRLTGNMLEAYYYPNQAVVTEQMAQTEARVTVEVERDQTTVRYTYPLCEAYRRMQYPRGIPGCQPNTVVRCQNSAADETPRYLKCLFSRRLYLWSWEPWPRPTP